MDIHECEVGDYVRYVRPLRMMYGIGRVTKIYPTSTFSHQNNGPAVAMRWSNDTVGGWNRELIEYLCYLELIPEEDVPLAALMLM